MIEKSLYTLNQEYLGMSTVVRAALFVRESDKNLKDSPTMESQVEDGRRYCQLKGYKLLEVNIYREAESAFYLPYHKREPLMQMLSDAHKKKFDVVVATEFSRLSRRGEQPAIIAQLKEYGVRVESVTQRIDDDEDDAMRDLRIAIYTYSARLDHAQTIYKLNRGKRDRAHNGNLTGHGKPKYGYSYIDTDDETSAKYVLNHTVILVDEDETVWTEVYVLTFMFEKVSMGWSCRRVALFLTEKKILSPKGYPTWSSNTVSRFLREEWYTESEEIDMFRWESKQKEKDKKPIMVRRDTSERIRIKRGDLVPVIIPRPLFDHVQKQLTINKEMALRSHKHTDRLGLMRSGFCKCAICGKTMKVHYFHSQQEHHAPEYYCRTRNGGEGLLNHHSIAIKVDTVDDLAWTLAKEYIADPLRVRRRTEEIRQAGGEPVDTVGIEKSLADIDKKIRNVIKLAQDATSDDTIAMLKDSIRQLEKQKDDLTTLKFSVADDTELLTKLYAEIDKFEAWANTARDLLDTTEINYATRQSTIRILGIKATISPATEKERIQFDVSPPDISKLLHDLAQLECLSW